MKKNYLKDIFTNYRRITAILWKISKGSVISILLLTALLGVLPNLSTIIMKDIINFIQADRAHIQTIIILVLFYIVTDLVLSVSNNMLFYVSSVYEQKLTIYFDMQILKKTAALGLKDFENSEIYDIIQRAQMQGGMQIFTYFSHITRIIQYAIMAIGAGIILSAWNWWVIIIVFAIAVLNALVLTKINEIQFDIIRNRTGKAREKFYYQFILTNDIAFKEIKTYGLHEYLKNKYKKIAETFFLQDKGVAKKVAGVGNIRVAMEQISDLFILSKIFYDTYCKLILIGDTIAYIRCISSIKGNVNGLLTETVNIYKETLYINQLFDFLDLIPSENNEGKIIIDRIQEVKISNLYYRYPDAKDYALKNINLEIHQGDNLVVVGRNGSGKSTLVKILAGFYEDYEGKIWINGIALKEIDKNSLRKRIGLLFQDFNKYEMPVRENVGMGNLKYLENDNFLREALKKSKAPERIANNLEQQLGGWFKHGQQLSGGEWLRVGISRVFIREADMYILDEPNASLDSIGEGSIFTSIRDLIKNKMSIIITHRIGSIEILGGKIIVMDGGEILAFGEHNILLETCEIYREMYMKCIQ